MIEVDLDYITSLTHNKVLEMGGESINFYTENDLWVFSFIIQNHIWSLQWEPAAESQWVVRVKPNTERADEVCFHQHTPTELFRYGHYRYGHYRLRTDLRDVEFKTIVHVRD